MIRNLVYDPKGRKLRFDLEGMIFLLATKAACFEGSRIVGFFEGQISRSPQAPPEQWGFRYDIDKRMILDPLLPEKSVDSKWQAYRETLGHIIAVLYDAGQIVDKTLKDSYQKL